LRRRLRRRALTFSWFRTRRQTALLAELADLFERRRTPCAIVGGFAIAALAGKTSRTHGDIDIAFLHRDRDRVFGVLEEAGFRVRAKNPCSSGAARRGLQIDLFHWRDAGDGRILHLTSDVAVRMPESFLTETQEVRLNGIRFRIPSMAYMASTLPFVQRPESRRFLQKLAADLPLQLDAKREQIDLTIAVTVHEATNISD
jgi:hypothetical protein